MNHIAMRRLAGAALLTVGMGLAAGLSSPAIAIDNGDSSSDSGSSAAPAGPSLAEARADIAAKHWSAAIAKLKLIVADDHSNADAYNLLGFAYRNAGNYDLAGRAYAKALKLNPKHTGALEYQGVLFIKLGEKDKAKANLETIKSICGTDCEAYKDLAEALG